MPDTLTAPPAAAPAPATPAPAARSSAPKAPASTVRLPPASSASEKPDFSLAKLQEKLEKKAVASAEKTYNRNLPDKPAPTAPETPPDASNGDGETQTPPDEQTPPEGQPDATKPAPKTEKGAALPPKPGDKAKPNPWKLVDEYKGKAAKLEAQIAELEKTGATPETLKKFEERATKAEQRAKELENEISFYDETNNADWKKQHYEPYEKQWVRSMRELSELRVETPEGQVVPFNGDHMLKLVNLPLQDATALAKEWFPDYYQSVINHRSKVKELLEAHNEAVQDSRRNSAQRLKERAEQKESATRDTRKLLSETWKAFNDEAQADPKIGHYFKPAEGDDQGNAALEKGYKLVDEAWQANPEAEGLTPEQRKEIVRKHTAVRNRAAAFGRLRLQLETKDARIGELEAKLKGYEDSEPKTQGSEEAPTQAAPQGDHWDSIKQRLLKKAI